MSSLVIIVTADECIDDSEILFRCVFYGRNLYKTEDNGTLRLSSTAFADKKQEPSVDRSSLCKEDPHWTQVDEKDGVVSIVTRDVRSIIKSGKNPDKNDDERTIIYSLDVVPKPTEDNEAHAVVQPSPEYQTKNVFKKVRESLARIASERGWVLPPHDLR
jgi:hypothetical protein